MKNRFVRDFTEPREYLCSFGPEVAVGTMMAAAGSATTLPVVTAAAAPTLGATIGSAVTAALPYISAAGTILQGAQYIQAGQAAKAQGRAAQQAAEFEAQQMERRQIAENAMGQRAAIEQRRRGDLVSSALQARAAASGGGTADPSIIDIEGDLGAETALRFQNALFEGESRGQGYQTGAALRRFEGDAARRGAGARSRGYYTGAAGTLFEGAARTGTLFQNSHDRSLYEKYGPRYG